MKDNFLFLRQKGEKFYSIAREEFLKGNYDMAALNLEQSIQLYLKFTIGLSLGQFPHTHNIQKLISGITDAAVSDKLKNFLTENEIIIKDIEKSYFESRYFDTPYTHLQIEEMFDFHKNLISIISKLWT